MKEKAKKIRAEIKRLGFTNKEISVRADNSAVYVTIKTMDAKKRIKDIEKIAVFDDTGKKYTFTQSNIKGIEIKNKTLKSKNYNKNNVLSFIISPVNN